VSLVVGRGVVEWVAKRTNEFGNFGTDAGIGWLKNGEIVAGVAYADWNGVNVLAHIASDGYKRWMTRQYLWTIFDYPFQQLKVNRITCLIGQDNKASIRLCEHFGFSLETTLKGAHPSGDLLVYVLWKKDCGWLNENLYPMRLRMAA
jgi:RimJ/RimL family protein N-acetyltransferase